MKRAFTKILALTMVVALLAGSFAGCMPKEPVETEDQTPPGLLTDDSTTPSETTTEPVDETQPEETEPDETRVNIATVTADQINIRTAPSSESTVIGQLIKGDEVEIVDEQTLMGFTWGKIESPNKGWIPMDLVNLPGGFVPPTEPEEPDETTPEGTEPEETKPNDNKDDGKGNGNTTAVFKGVTTASELNIRDKASTDGERVGSYSYGTRVEILEKSANWGRTNKGWISLDYVYQDGTTGKNTAKGVVLADTLNIRTGPGTNYGQAGSYTFGNRVKVLEQFTIGNTKWGCTDKGWISMEYIYVDGTTGENSGTGTVNVSDKLNIRSGPGTNFDIAGSYAGGTEVKIYTQIKIGDIIWGCTDKGWISMEYVDMN